MGWTGDYNDYKMDYKAIKNHMMNLWTQSNLEKTIFWEAEKTAIRGNVAYTIVHKNNIVTGEKESFIAVTLFRQNKYGHGYEFTYKEMSEHAGPYVYTCPTSYIKQLGGVYGINDEYAQNWRKNVLQYAEKERQIKEIRENGTPINIKYGNGEYTIAYDKFRDKWIVQGERTYIPKKFVKPENVLGIEITN